jgi:hypothetical protein
MSSKNSSGCAPREFGPTVRPISGPTHSAWSFMSRSTETLAHRSRGARGRAGRVLGRPRGLRIGEAADRDGQYFHYLAMWLFALERLGDLKPEYRERGVGLTRDIDPAFVTTAPGVKFAFTNYGISLGLQSVNQSPERVQRLNTFIEHYRE